MQHPLWLQIYPLLRVTDFSPELPMLESLSASDTELQSAHGHCQEPLNAPFLNGLFSSGFSRRKTAP